MWPFSKKPRLKVKDLIASLRGEMENRMDGISQQLSAVVAAQNLNRAQLSRLTQPVVTLVIQNEKIMSHLQELIEEVKELKSVEGSAVAAIDRLMDMVEEHINEPGILKGIVQDIRDSRTKLAEAVATVPAEEVPEEPPVDLPPSE